MVARSGYRRIFRHMRERHGRDIRFHQTPEASEHPPRRPDRACRAPRVDLMAVPAAAG